MYHRLRVSWALLHALCVQDPTLKLLLQILEKEAWIWGTAERREGACNVPTAGCPHPNTGAHPLEDVGSHGCPTTDGIVGMAHGEG